MDLSNKAIENNITNLFTYAKSNLGKDIINSFIPFGGFADLPQNDAITFAFEDELGELVAFIRQYDLLIQSTNDRSEKARFYLHIYCRIMENDFQYLIIYNLLRLLNKLEPDWNFQTVKNGEVFICENPSPKIDEIARLCKPHKLQIGKLLKNIWRNDIRNAFYHSQYYLSSNGSFTNTRSYSPATTHKPAFTGYSFSDIEFFYQKAEYFFDFFFRTFSPELNRFRDGNKYVLKNKRTIMWYDKSKKWILFS